MSTRRTRKNAEKADEEDLGTTHVVSPEPAATEHGSEQRMADLGSLAGNAAVAAAFGPSDAEAAVRSRAESITGYDLSPATVHHNSDQAASAGVHGLTVGRDVHLAPGISPGTPHGDHVLAHESDT